MIIPFSRKNLFFTLHLALALFCCAHLGAIEKNEQTSKEIAKKQKETIAIDLMEKALINFDKDSQTGRWLRINLDNWEQYKEEQKKGSIDLWNDKHTSFLKTAAIKLYYDMPEEVIKKPEQIEYLFKSLGNKENQLTKDGKNSILYHGLHKENFFLLNVIKTIIEAKNNKELPEHIIPLRYPYKEFEKYKSIVDLTESVKKDKLLPIIKQAVEKNNLSIAQYTTPYPSTMIKYITHKKECEVFDQNLIQSWLSVSPLLFNNEGQGDRPMYHLLQPMKSGATDEKAGVDALSITQKILAEELGIKDKDVNKKLEEAFTAMSKKDGKHPVGAYYKNNDGVLLQIVVPLDKKEEINNTIVLAAAGSGVPRAYASN